jgi:predicted nucleic acid-binding protein
MGECFFVDTNVLVYAHDPGSGAKDTVARTLLESLWEERSGVLSTQVLQEFCVNVRRQARQPMPSEEARRVVEDYLRWRMVVNDGAAVLRALDWADRYMIGFWDAMIVDAANQAAVEVLYSEDLIHGQSYGTARVVNPFLV